MKIVVIDDSEADRYLAQRALREACGARAIEYPAAYLAVDDFLDLQRAQMAFGDGEPVVILLDINMPRLDGFEFLDRLRQSPIADLIAVLLFTSSGLAEDRRRADSYEFVQGCITKPLTSTKVIEFASQLGLSPD